MFWQLIRGGIFRQKGKMLMIAITIALGASLATAMLSVMFDVGDKVNQELKTYGANINVISKEASLMDDLYGAGADANTSNKYLKEDELGKIKTIFWAFNIVDFTPYLDVYGTLGTGSTNDVGEPGGAGSKVKVVGTWFTHHLDLPTGESIDTGMISMKNWWTVDGQWITDDDVTSCMVGSLTAQQNNISLGDSIDISTGTEMKMEAGMDEGMDMGAHAGAEANKTTFRVAGIFNSGSDEDSSIYVPISAVQKMSGQAGMVKSVEVSALTTPDNELSRKAAQDPKSLSIKEWETWYCTAYVSSICYQIDEVLTDAVSKPIRQVAESEGAILDKTKLLMLLITVLSLAGSALGISNLVTASVIERSKQIGLLKAIGATNSAISMLVLTEILLTGLIGCVFGYFLGIGFAQVIGHTVFNAAINIKLMVIPIVAVMVFVVMLLGSIPSIRMLLSLRPAEVLHGR